jgi:hypothetical protein
MKPLGEMFNSHIQPSCVIRGLLPILLGFASVFALGSDPIDQKSSTSEMRDETRPPERIIHYFAQKAIRSILDNFDDAWALERIDSEWRNGDCFLRFHFQSQVDEPLILHAQINPAKGTVLNMAALERSKIAAILRAQPDEIGNVAALKRFFFPSENRTKLEYVFFRDYGVARIPGDFLRHEGFGDRMDFNMAEEFILVQSRTFFYRGALGNPNFMMVLDARTGGRYLAGPSDLLKRHWEWLKDSE